MVCGGAPLTLRMVLCRYSDFTEMLTVNNTRVWSKPHTQCMDDRIMMQRFRDDVFATRRVK